MAKKPEFILLLALAIAISACGRNPAGPSPVKTSTPTATITMTGSETASPSITMTGTITMTYTATPTNTCTYTCTVTQTVTETDTITETHTNSPTYTATPTFTGTPTITPTRTITCTKTPVTVVLYCNFANSGNVQSDGVVNTLQSQSRIYSGDSDANAGIQGLLSYNISSIPAGAVILDARFTIFFENWECYHGHSYSDAYYKHLHSNYEPLDASDYDPAPGAADGDLFLPGPLLMNKYRQTGNIAAHVQDDLDSGRGRTQIRIYQSWATDNDNSHEYNRFSGWGFDMYGTVQMQSLSVIYFAP